MFRLHKTKQPVKSGERIDFKFSQFKALQVPKGWDKLFVSIVSVETGKTIAKSGKAVVRNGNCQWKDSVSESIWISKDERSQSSKELEDCPYKLVLAMGSARSGILGEAVINMATYMSSSGSFPVCFPLKKCNHGTILQLNIQCLTPRINLREDGSKVTDSHKEDHNPESRDAEIKSEESDSTLSKSARSYSNRDLSSTIPQQDDEKNGEEGMFSTSGSDHSYNSAETSMEKEGSSPTDNLPSDENKLMMATQESTSSHNSEPPGSSNAENDSKSDDSPVKSQVLHSENLSQDDPREFSAPSLRISGSSKSLLETAEDTIQDLRSEVKTWERTARKLMVDSEILRKEFSEQSKMQANLGIELSAACVERDWLQKEVEQLKLLLEKSPVLGDSTVQDNVVKEMENEIRFLKETNGNLILQLNRSQESNVELVSVLQELEETIEKQKAEMENLQANVEKYQDLIFQVQQLQESEKNLLARLQELEKASEHNRIEKKEKQWSAELEATEGGDRSLIGEIEMLKAKLQELESDCQELTDENLELLLQLKEIKKNSTQQGPCLAHSRLEVSEHGSQIHELEQKMRKIETNHNLTIQELESQKSELEGKVSELSKELSEKGEVIDNLRKCQSELEEKLSALQEEKGKLGENVKTVIRESDITVKCLKDLEKDLMMLSNNVEPHFSDNTVLERKSSAPDISKQDLEIRVTELVRENEELSACISTIEAQVRNLIEERKSMELELENSKLNTVTVQEEIARLRTEMQIQETDARQNLQEVNYQLLQAREEVEHLRDANSKLETTAESLMEKCSSLQNNVRELRMQKLQLQEHCTDLETKLSKLQQNFDDCLKRASALQEKLRSLVEESASQERKLTSELDLLLKENEKQKQKLAVLDQMHMGKIVQVENLQQEVEDLNKQLSETREEKERIASNAEQEASDLCVNLAKIESELKTTQIKSKASIEDLMEELAHSKQNQEMLKSEIGTMLNLLEDYRSSEENFKTTINDLELKLTVSQYEHQQLIEETKGLKAELQRMGSLEEEVLELKNKREKLETSLNVKSEECKELKIVKSKITELQKAASELEDCKKEKFALEERVQKLERSLMANKALCEEEAELKKEISLIKRANKQLQQHIQQVEEEKEKLKTRAQSLGEELILMKERRRNRRDSSSINNSPSNQHHREFLEDEFSNSMEAKSARKVQPKRLNSENRKSGRKSKGEDEFVPKEKFEITKSSLETELRDLRERYFHMSLHYAEVEAQREDLVMKLKAANNGKRWF